MNDLTCAYKPDQTLIEERFNVEDRVKFYWAETPNDNGDQVQGYKVQVRDSNR